MKYFLLLWGCSKPTPQHQVDSVLHSNQDHHSVVTCQGCHVEQTQQWRSSRHSKSWTNSIFQVSFQDALLPNWCIECHRPLTNNITSKSFANEGISCTVCHLREGKITSSNTKWAELNAPHSLRYEQDFGNSEFCATCHQFNLPKYHPMYSEIPVQNTYEEWKSSGYKQTCQDCHMGKNGHQFSGGHDIELLRKSVMASVLLDENTVEVTIQTQGVGHAFPTGDPFRHLQWKLCSDPDCIDVVKQKTFEIIYRGPAWHVFRDNRLYPNQPQTFQFTRPTEKQWWKLIYNYTEPHYKHRLQQKDFYSVIHSGEIEGL